uniref:Uncharacterized protein n=3 Tax=Parascaris univalens TaxID=6257 RepID=A0A915BBI2_PARUN
QFCDRGFERGRFNDKMRTPYSHSTRHQKRTRSGSHSRRRTRSLEAPTGEREDALSEWSRDSTSISTPSSTLSSSRSRSAPSRRRPIIYDATEMSSARSVSGAVTHGRHRRHSYPTSTFKMKFDSEQGSSVENTPRRSRRQTKQRPSRKKQWASVWRFVHTPEIRVRNNEGALIKLQSESTRLLESAPVSGSISNESLQSDCRIRSISTSDTLSEACSEKTQYSFPLQGSVNDIFDSDICVTAVSSSPFSEHKPQTISHEDLYEDVMRRMERIANTVNMFEEKITALEEKTKFFMDTI